MYILPIISRSKGNQTTKFRQLLEYSKGNVFFQTSCWKWSKETSFRPLCFLKSFIWDKCKCFQLSYLIFNLTTNRSSHRSCSVKKCVLRNSVKLAGKHLCQSLFFNKVAGLRLYEKGDSGTGFFLWILRNF